MRRCAARRRCAGRLAPGSSGARRSRSRCSCSPAPPRVRSARLRRRLRLRRGRRACCRSVGQPVCGSGCAVLRSSGWLAIARCRPGGVSPGSSFRTAAKRLPDALEMGGPARLLAWQNEGACCQGAPRTRRRGLSLLTTQCTGSTAHSLSRRGVVAWRAAPHTDPSSRPPETHAVESVTKLPCAACSYGSGPAAAEKVLRRHLVDSVELLQMGQPAQGHLLQGHQCTCIYSTSLGDRTFRLDTSALDEMHTSRSELPIMQAIQAKFAQFPASALPARWRLRCPL